MFANAIYYRFLCLLGLVSLSCLTLASSQVIIDELLAKADADVVANRLTEPVNNNAFDRYQAVLLLDKGNQRAVLGLRTITDKYLAMSYRQLDRRNFASARRFLTKAIQVNGQSPKTRAAASEIHEQESKARQRLVRSVKPKTDDNEQKATFKLDPANLSQRNQTIIDHLFTLGQRVQGTREYILIYARNDAEGRWIYQQMRKASNGYRLRGNIKRHKYPRVVLEQPLD